MKQNYLLPHRFKIIGFIMLVPFLLGSLYCLFFDGVDQLSCPSFAVASQGLGHVEWFTVYTGGGILDEISMIGLIISFMFICFSMEKNEDEMIKSVRMQSLVWSLVVSSLILIFGILFFYEFAFLYFTFIYVFLIYVIFIVKFHYELNRFRRNIDE